MRCTIKAVHILIDGRDSDSVEFALREIKLEWGDCLRTITADTCPEFSTLNKDFEDTDTDIFYAHSYTSRSRLQRGPQECFETEVRWTRRSAQHVS